jgi:hypothetical protein
MINDLVFQRKSFASMPLGDQLLIYDLGSRTLFQLNSTARQIWDAAELPVSVESLSTVPASHGRQLDQISADDLCGFVEAWPALFRVEERKCASVRVRARLPEPGPMPEVETFTEERLRELYPDLIDNPIADFGDKWPGCIAPSPIVPAEE